MILNVHIWIIIYESDLQDETFRYQIDELYVIYYMYVDSIGDYNTGGVKLFGY